MSHNLENYSSNMEGSIKDLSIEEENNLAEIALDAEFEKMFNELHEEDFRKAKAAWYKEWHDEDKKEWKKKMQEEWDEKFNRVKNIAFKKSMNESSE